jgi:hypothetical protein
MLALSGLHPWEAAGMRHCGATFHTADNVYACHLDADHPGEHSGEPRTGRWYWRDGDRFVRAALTRLGEYRENDAAPGGCTARGLLRFRW